MIFLAAILPILASAAQASEPITVTAYPWAPFISPMGEPFRARTRGEDTFARWFHQADSNQNGTLTADEMRADADFTRIVTLDEFRRAASYRFQLLDSSGLGRVTSESLRMLLPSRPKEGRRVKRPKNVVDKRIGVPLPAGD